MESRSVGLLVVGLGVGIVVLGALILAGGFGWFGRLPGDLRFEGERTRVYAPLVSMLVVSLVLSLLLSLFRRWL